MAKRELAGGKVPTKRDLAIELTVMLVIGLALAALGPFGSFAMGAFADRLAYWLPMSLIGYAIFRPAMMFATTQARRLDLPELGGLLAGVMFAAAPLSLLVLWWNGDGFAALPDLQSWLQLYLQVALVGGLTTFIFVSIEPRTKPSAQVDTAATASDPVPSKAAKSQPFLDRLPPSWNGELVALEMEDHYVRAHGPGSSTLILMRMRDAENELAGIDGMRVHRSWWVARSAVERVVRDRRKIELRLRGGLAAPVARDRLPALRTAGWID